jgi:hypothetical protein
MQTETDTNAQDEIDVHSLLASRRQIAVIWSIADVLAIRSDLSDDQCWQVLQAAERGHDADHGIHWHTLESIVEELFGDPDDFSDTRGQP